MLLVGGGCRGRRLAARLSGDGHALRITTRGEAGRSAIEAVGAECWLGTPDRLATLRQALDGVTIAGWLLGTASASDAEAVAALHGVRLRYWLTQVIDTTVRGVIYEAAGSVAAAPLAEGERLARAACALNSIPLRVIDVDPRDGDAWQAAGLAAVQSLLR